MKQFSGVLSQTVNAGSLQNGHREGIAPLISEHTNFRAGLQKMPAKPGGWDFTQQSCQCK